MRLSVRRPDVGLGALVARTVPLATTLVAAALSVAVHPVQTTVGFGIVALVFAALAVMAPREPLPLITIGCLLAAYVGATQHLDASSRAGTAAIEALVLYVLHSEFALAGAVPLRAAVDASVWRRLLQRALPLGLAGSALAAATVALADHAPRSSLLAPVGVVVAFALGALGLTTRHAGSGPAGAAQVPRVTERIEPGPS